MNCGIRELCLCLALAVMTNAGAEAFDKRTGKLIGLEAGNGAIVVWLDVNHADQMYWDSTYDRAVFIDAHDKSFHWIDRGPCIHTLCSFIGTLKAGSYELVGFTAIKPGDGSNVLFKVFEDHYLRLTGRLGDFVVRPGQLTDLGEIVVQKYKAEMVVEKATDPQPDSGVQHGVQYASTIEIGLLPSDEVLRSDVRTVLAGAMSPSALDAPLTWARMDPVLPASAERVMSDPAAAGGPLVLRDGTVVVPMKFGGILHRSPEGVWRTSRIGTPFALLAMAQKSDGTVAAAAADGSVYSSTSAEGPWTRLSTQLPGEVDQIAFMRDGGLLLLIEKHKLRLNARATLSGALPRKNAWIVLRHGLEGKWDVIGSVEQRDSLELADLPEAWVLYVVGSKSFHVISKADATIKSVKTKKQSVDSASEERGGVIFATESDSQVLSVDYGQTWLPDDSQSARIPPNCRRSAMGYFSIGDSRWVVCDDGESLRRGQDLTFWFVDRPAPKWSDSARRAR